MDKKNNFFHLFPRVREGLLILSIAASLFTILALVTYHHSDPSWSHSASTYKVANAGGIAGAWLSDIFLYFCGYLAYLFPVVLSYEAWRFYRHHPSENKSQLHQTLIISLRIMGFLLVLIAGTSLANLFVHPQALLPLNSGGILGSVMEKYMLEAFNYSGATLVLIAALLIGVTLLSGLSWFKLLEILGSNLITIGQFIFNFFHKFEWPEIKIPHIPRIPRIRSKPTIQKTDPVVEAPITKRKISTPIAAAPIDVMDTFAEENPPEKLLVPRTSHSKILPKLDLLDTPTRETSQNFSEVELEKRSEEVEARLLDFGVEVKVVAVYPGPVVTRFELQLAAGTKVNKVTSLALDLARSLSVISARVVEVIPGKSVIGLELPNDHRELVTLQEVLASKQYKNAHSSLTLALGKDIAGHPMVVDLAKMPHLLVAGTTGSGKSVCLNTMLLSLLYKSTPQQLRLILIDPKMLELAVYDGIPHLLTPVVTDMKDAAHALRWAVAEMERRYRLMASLGVRNIAGYNLKIKQAEQKGTPLLDTKTSQELQELPQIVVLADEFADMMMVVGKKVETLIARLAQKARAAGVHLILATQRPSVDVITGLIKANIPTRIAFQVSSKIDSRTILDQQGAEHLLGHGDMLYLAPGTGVPVRVHGAFVSDDEVHRVVNYLKEHGEPDYLEEIFDETAHKDLSGYTEAAMDKEDAEQDPLYDEAVGFVVDARRASVSSLQRRFKIGYNRAACIIEAMEKAGIVGKLEGTTREVLVPSTSKN